ncbi:MAG: hypothetical protein R3D68_04700 [Hyphomicrobiaceae bacterium]
MNQHVDVISLPLVVRSRVPAWGFVYALCFAAAFFGVGIGALGADLVPPRLGVFVAPPEWLVGALLIGIAGFLVLVGISEFVRYLWPTTEVVIDKSGIRAMGLLGARRAAWSDITALEIRPAMLALPLRGSGKRRPGELRIHFDRVDASPAVVLAAIHACRPDLSATAPGEHL